MVVVGGDYFHRLGLKLYMVEEFRLSHHVSNQKPKLKKGGRESDSDRWLTDRAKRQTFNYYSGLDVTLRYADKH